MADPRIRLFEPRDAEGVKRLVEEVLPAYGLTVDFTGADADLADVLASYAGGVFFVIEERATSGAEGSPNGRPEAIKRFIVRSPERRSGRSSRPASSPRTCLR